MNDPTSIRRITISLPENLIEFADQRATRLRTNRSQVISEALTTIKAFEEERLAAEGYQFYAEEAVEFAAVSAEAAAEAWATKLDYLFEKMDALAALDLPRLTEEETEAEIQAVRRERRSWQS